MLAAGLGGAWRSLMAHTLDQEEEVARRKYHPTSERQTLAHRAAAPVSVSGAPQMLTPDGASSCSGAVRAQHRHAHRSRSGCHASSRPSSGKQSMHYLEASSGGDAGVVGKYKLVEKPEQDGLLRPSGWQGPVVATAGRAFHSSSSSVPRMAMRRSRRRARSQCRNRRQPG